MEYLPVRDEDGHNATSIRSELNNLSFVGGPGDGFSLAGIIQPFNNGLFTGGGGDGFNQDKFAQLVNNPLFAGGEADGFVEVALKQSLNNSIYSGGQTDGFSDSPATQPVNNSIFSGGAEDGVTFRAYLTRVSEVVLSVVLQGPYDATSEMHSTELVINQLLPLVEPYTGLGYDLQNSGAEILGFEPFYADIADWIVVELVSVSDQPEVARAALLLKDGTVVDTKGSPSIKFTNLSAGDYHIIVRHRNHLGVMTNSAVTLEPGY